jgi:hypothetical protein
MRLLALLLALLPSAALAQPVSPPRPPAIGTITDGTHTVARATNLTVTGGTVGGTSPNATLTIAGGGSTPSGNVNDIQVKASGTAFGSITPGTGVSTALSAALNGTGALVGSTGAAIASPVIMGGSVSGGTGSFTTLDGIVSSTLFGFPGVTANLGSGGVTSLTDGTATANFVFKSPLFDTDKTITIQNNASGFNTLGVQNLNPSGFSAVRFLDFLGNEVGAVHADNNASFVGTGSVSGTTLTIASVTNNTVQLGQTLNMAGATTQSYVSAFLTGTGGAGTYTLSASEPTVGTETVNLMAGGTSLESSSLYPFGSYPSAAAPSIDIRQTYQPGGVLTFVHAMTVDYLSEIHMSTQGQCNASGQIQDTIQILRVGYLGVCAGATYPGAGVSFGVNWGGAWFSRTNVGGNVAANADVTISNATAPDLKFNVPFGGGWTADVLLNTTGTTHRLDFVDTQGGSDVPFSIALDSSRGVTMGGPTRYTGTVSSAPTTGATVTFATAQRLAIINPAGTLAALTVQLPACAVANDGDERVFLTTQTLTALTVSAASGSVGSGAATSVAAGGGYVYHCLGSATTWYQIGSGTGAGTTLSGTTSSIGGSALLAGACTSGTVAVTGSTTAMGVVATPVTYPGDGFDWEAFVSAAGTVTVKVCGFIAGTPVASAYNVRVLQ